MPKNIIVSNRLPVQVENKNQVWTFTPTSGGLATGLKSVHEEGDSLWIGWPGVSDNLLDKENKIQINEALSKNQFRPVFLDDNELDHFYLGFSNKCLWPLFHYFIEYAKFNENDWKSYVKVNQKFCDEVVKQAAANGTVWVHDYQLLLLPKMIKESRPDLTIGFFLHIPFPSFEIFRIFPWRNDLLEGILGADLVGFHTFDYQRHFLSSVKRILRYDVDFNRVNLGSREVVVNTFPMGIDYDLSLIHI